MSSDTLSMSAQLTFSKLYKNRMSIHIPFLNFIFHPFSGFDSSIIFLGNLKIMLLHYYTYIYIYLQGKPFDNLSNPTEGDSLLL